MNSHNPQFSKPDFKKLIKTARENVSHHQDLVAWAENHLSDARRQLQEAETYLRQLLDRKPPSVILRRSKDTWRQQSLTIIEAFNDYDHDHLVLEPKQVKELRKLLQTWDENAETDGVIEAD